MATKTVIASKTVEDSECAESNKCCARDWPRLRELKSATPVTHRSRASTPRRLTAPKGFNLQHAAPSHRKAAGRGQACRRRGRVPPGFLQRPCLHPTSSLAARPTAAAIRTTSAIAARTPRRRTSSPPRRPSGPATLSAASPRGLREAGTRKGRAPLDQGVSAYRVRTCTATTHDSRLTAGAPA